MLVPDLLPLAGVCGGGTLLVSFAVWLRFLSRLGHRLGDHTLVASVWSFGGWFSAGLALASCAFVLSVLFTLTRDDGHPFGWFGRTAAEVIVLLLLVAYALLLRTAALAVSSRAPVKHGP
jgi:hypothetical protein